VRLVLASFAASSIFLAGLWTATQFVTSVFDPQAALGRPLFLSANGGALYPPWSVLIWSERWGELYPRPFAIARLIVLAAAALAFAPLALALRTRFTPKPFAKHAWASRSEAAKACLFAEHGVILGKFRGEILAFDGPEHQLLIGASRSGKGRGQIVPTLLATPHSALVVDVKGELADGDARHGFLGTAGFRERLGPVLRFAPTKATSARFNPLFEVRRGPNEIRDIQNLMDVVFSAYDDGPQKDFWARSAANIAAPVALHVLYAEPIQRKTLAVVRERLRDLSKTCDEMRRTLHRISPQTGQPEIHPEILHAAESFLSAEDRMRSGIQATAESMFGLFADPLVAANTASSDFRIGDLMSWERPVTLYLQPPPGDAPRLAPLMRAIIDLTGRALMESQTHDSQGRQKLHRLVMMLDEFPVLGRLPFFETMMGAMAGYGLKAFIVCQSLNHLSRVYGRDNVILDNCHIVTAFAATDTDTAKRIAEMAGEVWEVRESETRRKPRPLIGWTNGSTTLREERRPLLLAGDVRALAREQALIFVAGAKPIRARKLEFDRERVFKRRLRASTQGSVELTTAHDWTNVRPIGFLPQQKPLASRRKTPEPQQTDQGDLFDRAREKAPKLSDLALAGFRHRDGARMTPQDPPPSGGRSTGI
jgi:type IV secretion system protein VirD4